MYKRQGPNSPADNNNFNNVEAGRDSLRIYLGSSSIDPRAISVHGTTSVGLFSPLSHCLESLRVSLNYLPCFSGSNHAFYHGRLTHFVGLLGYFLTQEHSI